MNDWEKFNKEIGPVYNSAGDALMNYKIKAFICENFIPRTEVEKAAYGISKVITPLITGLSSKDGKLLIDMSEVADGDQQFVVYKEDPIKALLAKLSQR